MNRTAALAAQFRTSNVGRWYYGRERSEQKIIAGLAALLLLLLAWAFLWQPLADWRTQEQNRYHNAQQLLDWLQSNRQAAVQAAADGSAGQGGRGPLIPIINKAAKAHNLQVNRLQPESNGVVSVILQKQSFNQIVNWINQLEENNGVLVERANFDEQDAPGYVNAQIRLN